MSLKKGRRLRLRFQSTIPVIPAQFIPAAARSAVSFHSRLILRFALWGDSDRIAIGIFRAPTVIIISRSSTTAGVR
ncbi:hypothetical protein V6N13_124388 [Hibiscus sabdariffa]|uniref:Uncharacterized protein n=1 Tax=Hibiscus sabdariffa TaxID=183260 RepID=A0ABR2S165_9ROSI